jgi:hypothetical protein
MSATDGKAAIPPATTTAPTTVVAGQTTAAANDWSFHRSLFVDPVPADYVCGLCHRVPLAPVNPKCCGHIRYGRTRAAHSRTDAEVSASCRQCIERCLSANPECPHCREPLVLANVTTAIRSRRPIPFTSV